MLDRIDRRAFMERAGAVGLAVLGSSALVACSEQRQIGVAIPLDTRVRVIDRDDSSIFWVNLRSDWDNGGNYLSDFAIKRLRLKERPYRDSEAGAVRVGLELQAVVIIRGTQIPQHSRDFYMFTPEEIERIAKEQGENVKVTKRLHPPYYYYINSSYIRPLDHTSS